MVSKCETFTLTFFCIVLHHFTLILFALTLMLFYTKYVVIFSRSEKMNEIKEGLKKQDLLVLACSLQVV